MNEFWITNISKKDVLIRDLNIRLKAMSSINLLSKNSLKTISITDIENSCNKGFIFENNKIIKIRKISPITQQKILNVDFSANIPNRQRSVEKINTQKYDELELNDDDILSSINEEKT